MGNLSKTRNIILFLVMGALIVSVADLGLFYYTGWGEKNQQNDSFKKYEVIDGVENKIRSLKVNQVKTSEKNLKIKQSILAAVDDKKDFLPLERKISQVFRSSRPSVDLTVTQGMSALSEIHEILKERRYRLRHRVKTLQREFREVSEQALLNNSRDTFDSFYVRVEEFEALLTASQVRPEYKERTLDVIEELKHVLKLGSKNASPAIFTKADRSALLNELAPLKSEAASSVYQHTKAITKVPDFLWSRTPLYAGVFLLMIAGVALSYLQIGFKKMAYLYSMRRHFKKHVKKSNSIKKKVAALKKQVDKPIAVVKANGKISWMSDSFADFFYSDPELKRGWTSLKSKYFVNIEKETGVKGSFKLLNNLNQDYIIKEGRHYKSEGGEYVVEILELNSYFKEISDFMASKGVCFQMPSLGDGYCLVENVVDELLIGKMGTLKNLNLSLEFSHKLPRILKINEKVVSQCIEQVLQILNMAIHLKRGGSIPVNLDYDKKGQDIFLVFRLEKRRIDSQVLEQKLKYAPAKKNLADSFSNLESQYQAYRCQLKVRNVFGESESDVLFSEISVKLSENKNELIAEGPRKNNTTSIDGARPIGVH